MQHIFKLIFLVGVCLSQLTLVHLTAQGNTIDTYALKYPEKKDLFIKEKETIRIIAKLNSTESLLVLNSQTLPLESKKQKLVLDINLGKKAIQTRLDPGENKAVLYWFNEDGKWDLGNWKLSLPPKNDNPLHEIEHKFKPDPPKPNKTIAFGFVGLTLLPWLFLLSAWIGLKANINYLFVNPKILLSGVVFLTSLLSCLGLYFVYWWTLGIFDLLYYGSILGSVCAISGWFCLSQRATIH